MSFKTKIFIGMALLIVILGGYIYFMNKNSGPRIVTDLSHPAVIKEVRQLGKLETAQFTLEKVIDTKVSQDNAIKELLFGDRLLLIAHGTVTAGVNLESLPEDSVSVDGTSLTVSLSDTELFSTSLDPTQTRVFDRKLGLLTKGDVSLESEARSAAESSLTSAACEAGILEEARKGAIDRIKQLYTLAGFSEVNVDVQAGECS